MKQYYQHNQNSEERNEYHELDQTEEQLKVRAEPPPSDRYDLKRQWAISNLGKEFSQRNFQKYGVDRKSCCSAINICVD